MARPKPIGRRARLRALLVTAEQHTRRRKYARAVVFYRRVIAHTQDGDYERELAHARLGDLHLGLGQPARALPHLRRALALSGGEPEYALMVGTALLRLGDAEGAAPHLHAAVGCYHEADALARLAEARALQGDRAGARALARLAAARDPRHAELGRLFADA